MTQWYVKDLSQLTGVSKQTLHHYDRVQLLKPSLRLDNGYRVYSEKDLLKLQQIIALKFFGFDLAQINALLAEERAVLEHLNDQARVLEQKAAALLEGARTLRGILGSVGKDQSVPWETIIQLIEVYKMTEQLEETWVKEIFTSEELKQYATFEKELKANSTPEQRTEFENSWAQLVNEVRSNLAKDPSSQIGIDLGKKTMDWVNKVYGKKYAHLRTKKFEQGFGKGKGLDEVGLTPEIVVWMDKAIDAYWTDRIYGILDQVGKAPAPKLLSLWNSMLVDMYGDDKSHQKGVYDLAFADDKISAEAKAWLKGIRH